MKVNNTVYSINNEEIKNYISTTTKKVIDVVKKVFFTVAGLGLFFEGARRLNAIPYIGPFSQALALLILGGYLINESAKMKEATLRPQIPSCLIPLSKTGVVCGERKEEVNQIAEVLSITGDVNSVILVGPAGCGKTTLALSFAQLAPTLPGFEETDIYELSWGALLSDVILLGQLDKKIVEMLKFIEQPGRKKIIYMDEAHRLYESPDIKTMRPLNIANAFKPLLASGKLRMIAATTDKEYRLIESDPALERRFFEIRLKPLTYEQMITTFTQNKKQLFEDKYKITLPNTILKTALERSQQINGSFPDKGMRLLSLICAKASRTKHKVATTSHIEEAMKLFSKPSSTFPWISVK